MQLRVNGKDAYCYTGGKAFDPTLPAVAFIHGAQNDHSVWALQSRYFAHHGFGVLAIDLPGHGRSKGQALSGIEQMAEWLLALLEAAEVRQAMLVGHSMGSLIALEAAARSQQRVSHIALLAAAYPMKVSGDLLEAARTNEPQAIDMVNVWSHSSIAQKPSFPAPGFWVHGGSKRLMQRISSINPNQVFHTDFAACNAYANGEQAAASVKCPALFLLGRRDIMTPPRAANQLIRSINNAQVVMVEGSGHSLMAEQPDAVLEALFGFARAAGRG